MQPDRQAWLLRLVRQHRPRLLALGPLYRMVKGDIQDKEQVRCWQRLLEPLLEENVSIIIEHHSPKRHQPQRAQRPAAHRLIGDPALVPPASACGAATVSATTTRSAQCATKGTHRAGGGALGTNSLAVPDPLPGSDIWSMHDVKGEAAG